MASTQKRKHRAKRPAGRPQPTSAISQPLVDNGSHLTTLSAFSPDGALFALLSLAVDKHRLHIYNTSSGQAVADHVIDAARVSCLSWASINFASEDAAPTREVDADQPNKKKRKKYNNSAVCDAAKEDTKPQVVALGLYNGMLVFFSPTHARVVRTMSHPASTSAILAVEAPCTYDSTTIWSSSEDSTLRLWDVSKNEVLGSWKNDDRTAYSSLATRPDGDASKPEILAAHHSIRLMSLSLHSANFSALKPTQLSSFTGHASPIKLLRWDQSTVPSAKFVSMAQSDRFLYLWETDCGTASQGKPVASIPLDSDARTFTFATKCVSEKQTIATLSASGKVSLYPIPTELSISKNSSRTPSKIPTLLPRSVLGHSSKNATSSAHIVDISFPPQSEGSLRIVRLLKGVCPVFDIVQYLDASGQFIPEVMLDDVSPDRIDQANLVAPMTRYAQPSSVAVTSGIDIGQDEAVDALTLQEIDGALDVDLAELSLGQRLAAVSDRRISDSDSDGGHDDQASAGQSQSTKHKKRSGTAAAEAGLVPANSLTRTLIQALHSSDTRLLEMCLAHSDVALIRNTVQRLPPQLAVPLVTECAERLGRGARAGNMKGGGGGASAQRGTGLITWVKTVLTIHAGHLMTIPNLVARLSGLHATISARLALHESLLLLNGRLDMVISQIEMRSSVAPAPLLLRKGKAPVSDEKHVTRYVEGESDSSADEEVEIESADEEGSIEDIELGGSDSDEEEVSEGEDDDIDEGSDGSPSMNGFIDDEAQEDSEDEDDSE